MRPGKCDSHIRNQVEETGVTGMLLYAALQLLSINDILVAGEESVSCIGCSNFFKKLGNQLSDPSAWGPFLANGSLKLRLTVQGGTVE